MQLILAEKASLARSIAGFTLPKRFEYGRPTLAQKLRTMPSARLASVIETVLRYFAQPTSLPIEKRLDRALGT